MLHHVRAATDTVREVLAYYVVLTIISTSVFVYVEDYPLWKCLYWSIMTSTSVGYGDVTPKTQIGEADAMFTAVISLFVIAPMIIVRLIELVNGNKDMEYVKQELAELKALVKSLKE